MLNVEGVLDLYKEYGVPQKNEVSLRDKIWLLLDDLDYYLLTEERDGRVVATIMAVVMRNLVGDGSDQMIIENVITAKEYERQGLARKLFQRAEEIARHRDCRKIIVVTGRRWKAGGFYRSLGFEGESSEVYIKRL